MKKMLLGVIAILALSATACSPFQIKTDYAQSAPFGTYKTYTLNTEHLKVNDLDKDRIISEVSKQLAQKGFKTSANADVIVNIQATHKKIQDIRSTHPNAMWGWGGPWGWGFGVGHTWTSNYNSGTLVVDIIDNQTNKLVWQGIGSGINVDNPQAKQKEIPQIVSELFNRFPPKK
ncbi:DUF4136 domain-containing protein [Riemerella columbina]|uniref:DUF4136 domain-containing protein n=1 Tax=Riemerella columbina TaxID=103810 RepID=UPI0003711DAF|nr:DUF4136 domain-containing protein [Riemerella columbina]